MNFTDETKSSAYSKLIIAFGTSTGLCFNKGVCIYLTLIPVESL